VTQSVRLKRAKSAGDGVAVAVVLMLSGSPQSGICCDDQCNFKGLAVTNPALLTLAAPSGSETDFVADGGLLCGQESDCFQPRFCINDATFEGQCPPQNFVYRQDPADRKLINAAPVRPTRLVRN